MLAVTEGRVKPRSGPVPDKKWQVVYNAWLDPTEMTVNTSTPSIPTEWHDLIKERALWYAYRYRGHDFELFTARDNYKDSLKLMRRKLIGFPEDMKDSRIWQGSSIITATTVTTA